MGSKIDLGGANVEVSRSHTVSDGMYADMKTIFVSLL